MSSPGNILSLVGVLVGGAPAGLSPRACTSLCAALTVVSNGLFLKVDGVGLSRCISPRLVLANSCGRSMGLACANAFFLPLSLCLRLILACARMLTLFLLASLRNLEADCLNALSLSNLLAATAARRAFSTSASCFAIAAFLALRTSVFVAIVY